MTPRGVRSVDVLPQPLNDSGSKRLLRAVNKSEALISSTLAGIVKAQGDSRTGAALRPVADLYSTSVKASHPKLQPLKPSKYGPLLLLVCQSKCARPALQAE